MFAKLAKDFPQEVLSRRGLPVLYSKPGTRPTHQVVGHFGSFSPERYGWTLESLDFTDKTGALYGVLLAWMQELYQDPGLYPQMFYADPEARCSPSGEIPGAWCRTKIAEARKDPPMLWTLLSWSIIAVSPVSLMAQAVHAKLVATRDRAAPLPVPGRIP